MFAVVARRHQLTAVDPVGAVRWSLAAPRPVSNPAWSPSGVRVAYMSGSSLRVVAGDGRAIARSRAGSPPSSPPGGRSASPCPRARSRSGRRRTCSPTRIVAAGWPSVTSTPIGSCGEATAMALRFEGSSGRRTAGASWSARPRPSTSSTPEAEQSARSNGPHSAPASRRTTGEPHSSGGPRPDVATCSSRAATAAAHRGAFSPVRVESRIRPGHPTANGYWWHGPRPITGSSSVPRDGSGLRPWATFPASSPPAPLGRQASHGSAAGAAPADGRGNPSPTRPRKIRGASRGYPGSGAKLGN